MSYIGNVTVDSTTHLVGSTLYGTCNTGAGTKDKVVTCANFDKLLTGVTIHVKFDNTNTIADPTLNVNSTGAKAIKRYGTTAPSTTTSTSWNAGQVVSFTYDGTYWMMNDYNLDTDINTHREISVDGTQILANNTTTALNLKGGTNVSINATSGSGDVTINANDTNIHRCTMDTSSTATAFVVNTDSNDSVTALKDGLTIYVRNPVIASASGCTLNLNGLGAKRIWLSQGNGYCTTHWAKNQAYIFVYNAKDSVWELQQGKDTDTNDQAYQVRDYYNNFVAGANKIFPYTFIMQCSDGRWESIVTSSSTGTSKARNTHGFRLGQLFLMYANATYEENGAVGNTNVWSAYNSGLVDHRYSFNTANNATSGTTAKKPVYLVGAINNTDGLFYLDTKWWTQTLPSTADGKLYIYLGDAHDYYRMSFVIHNHIYRYIDGKIQEYSQSSSYADNSGTVGGKTITDTYSSTSTNGMSGKAVASAITSAIGGLDVTGASGIGANKTISAWSETDGKVSVSTQDISITKSQVSDFPTSMTPTSHTHGNIQNGGTLQTNDITIASGDKLVVTDSSDSNKIARTSVSFDGSTATKCLTQKGTFETFGTSNLALGTTATTALKGDTKYAGSSTAGGSASKLAGTYSGSGGKQPPSYFGKNNVGALMSNETVNGDAHYKNWLYMDNYSGTDAGGATAIGVDRSEARAFIMQSDANRTSWNNAAELAKTTDIPTNVSELTNDAGYTTNIGTVTQVKVGNTAYDPSSGVISLPAYPSDTNNAVTQTATSTNANYEVLFSVTADNTTRTEGARKNTNLKFNPSTGNLQTTQLNGVAIGTSPKFTDTDTKVTAVGNHYAPTEDTSATLSADASGGSAATWNSTQLVTGVDIKRDAKGHVTGVAVDSIKFPSNPNSDIKVRQTLQTDNTDRPLLLSYSNNTTTTGNVDNVSYRSNKIYANASTGEITANSFNGLFNNHQVEQDLPSPLIFRLETPQQLIKTLTGNTVGKYYSYYDSISGDYTYRLTVSEFCFVVTVGNTVHNVVINVPSECITGDEQTFRSGWFQTTSNGGGAYISISYDNLGGGLLEYSFNLKYCYLNSSDVTSASGVKVFVKFILSTVS